MNSTCDYCGGKGKQAKR